MSFTCLADDFLPPRGEAGEPALRALAWNIVRRCARACAACAVTAGPWAGVGGDLSTVESLHVGGQIGALSGRPLLAIAGGDPLAREDLETIAGHATRRGAHVVVATPGAALTDARIHALLRAGVRGFVLVLPSREDAAPAHGARTGAPPPALQAAARCAAAGAPFAIAGALTPSRTLELEAVAAWAEEAGALSLTWSFPAPAGPEAPWRDGARAGRDALDASLLSLAARAGSLRLHLPRRLAEGAAPACGCGRLQARITHEGKLTSCPLATAVVGDLRRKPMDAAWREGAARAWPDPPPADAACWHDGACGGCAPAREAVS